MSTIREEIESRGISEVVHFTSNHGFVGCLTSGSVISRRQLPENKHLSYVAAPTATTRQEAAAFFNKDEDWLDYINMSVSEINFRYFDVASSRWHVDSDRWWLIMSFDPEILTHEGVYFTTTNNVYPPVRRGRGVGGFLEMFAPLVPRKPGWFARRLGRSPKLATCEQAEVLYPRALSLDYLRRVYVKTDDQHDVVSGWLRMHGRGGVMVIVSPQKFQGQPN